MSEEEKEEQIVRLKDVWPFDSKEHIDSAREVLVRMFDPAAAKAGLDEALSTSFLERNIMEVGGRDYAAYPTTIRQMLLLAAALKHRDSVDLNYTAPGMLALLMFLSISQEPDVIKKILDRACALDASKIAPGIYVACNSLRFGFPSIGARGLNGDDDYTKNLCNSLLTRDKPFSLMKNMEGWDMPIGYLARKGITQMGMRSDLCPDDFQTVFSADSLNDLLALRTSVENPAVKPGELLAWMCMNPYVRFRSHRSALSQFGPKTLQAIRDKFPFALPDELDTALRGAKVSYDLLDYVKQADTSGVVDSNRMRAYIKAHIWFMDHSPVYHYSERRLSLRILAYAFLADDPISYAKRMLKRLGGYLNRTVYLATDGSTPIPVLRALTQLFEDRRITVVITTCVTMTY